MTKLFLIGILGLWWHIIFAHTVTNPAVDEIMLSMCQTNGLSLYNSCVAVVPVSTEQIMLCTGLKANYLQCLVQLTLPYPLVPAIDPDPYIANPFTPCAFETAHLILPGICVTLP